MERYDISDTGPDDLYIIKNEPNSNTVNEVINNIKQRLRDNPQENFLIVYVVVGQGMESYGQQIMLLNEFNDKTGFYRHWSIESDIREIASTFSNSYQVVMLACSRETKRASIHIGGFGGTKQEAEQYFAKSG